MNKLYHYKEKIKKKIDELFGADLRSLAIFRIGIASILILDLINRARNLDAHYTDQGILPRTAVQGIYSHYMSIHMLSGDKAFEAFLFILAGIFALALLVGFYTKTVTFISWFFLVSLQARNTQILHGGDLLLRILLFWSLFLPLGARYSIDSLLNKSKKKLHIRILSWGTFGIYMQIVFLYLFSVWFKISGKEWLSGTAVYYTLSIDHFATNFGKFLLYHPILLKYLTYSVLTFEFIGTILLFTPIMLGPIRTLIIILFILMQIGFGISIRLGFFPVTASVAMLCLIPTWFWDKFFICIEKTGIKKYFNKYCYKKKILQKAANIIPQQNINFKSSLIASCLVAFFLVYIFFSNMQSIGAYGMPSNVKSIGYALSINQKWNMFAPTPRKNDGWFVVVGRLQDGKYMDVMRNKPVSWEKPKLVSSDYEDQNWNKYMFKLGDEEGEIPRYYGRYLCYNWNTKNEENQNLEEVTIYYMLERTLPNYQHPPIKKIPIWNEIC